ncbi:MAG: malonyl-CoA O-methyltransferase [Paraglaciecola sp.]|jgi:malonyl-CoA O-methyltransferase
MQINDFKADNKERVARQFSRAANTYDQAAEVQVDIAFDAMQMLQGCYSNLVDIGCGTGRVSQQLAARCDKLLAMDLAEGMLSYAAQKYSSCDNKSNITWLLADAENLPLRSNSADAVFSTMALQWCQNIEQVCQEVYRVLRPKGDAVLAILCEGSMQELQQCWRKIDSQRHVNQFFSQQSWRYAARQAGFTVNSHEQSYQTWHNNVRDLLGSIKAIGANVVTETGNHAPVSRQMLNDLQECYAQQYSCQGKLPLTYQVCFLQLSKPGE